MNAGWPAAMAVVLAISGCGKETDHEPVHPVFMDVAGFPPPLIPEDNPLTDAGIHLGRMLFYEPMLSADNSMSCASCHNQKTAFSDTARFSTGVQGLQGGRQAMAVFNMAWHSNGFFWDGRAQLLRHQALMPIQDPLEMDEQLGDVVVKLVDSNHYRYDFERAFGSPFISAERIALALEQFMLSIVSHRSKFDGYLTGNTILTEQEERGRFLFFTEYNPGFPDESGADCQHCHGGANFENDSYMNNGLDTDASLADLGREAVTGNPADRGKFKVTSLRNITLTPPYMHDGRFETLEEVVNHYNQVLESATLDPAFNQQMPQGLNLSSEDKAALVAFLHTLTDHELAKDTRYRNPFE